MLNLIPILNKMLILMKKILNFKLLIMIEFQNKKRIFAKGCTLNWSEEVLYSAKLNTMFHVIKDFNDEKTVETFCEKELQKANQKEFRIEIIIKRKRNKLYVKCKSYDNSFNSCIGKKDIV